MQRFENEADRMTIGISDVERISEVARALSVPGRVEILKLLERNTIMSVNQLSKSLKMPISTVSLHVSILEKAGLLICEKMPSIHGNMKTCMRSRSSILFNLLDDGPVGYKLFSQFMPIGAYCQAKDISSPCGLASDTGPIGLYNKASSFYLPERIKAQILWFKSGSVIYSFSPLDVPGAEIAYLDFSAEICPHARINELWKSEFCLIINGCNLGTVTCSCIPEGRRGVFNPSWWPDVATQFGKLFNWRVTNEGCFLQNNRFFDVTLKDLNLNSSDPITVEILAPSDSRYPNGLNLFGTSFGDFNQPLHLLIAYH